MKSEKQFAKEKQTIKMCDHKFHACPSSFLQRSKYDFMILGISVKF